MQKWKNITFYMVMFIFLVFSAGCSLTSYKVSGTIVDVNGAGLQGVSVKVDGDKTVITQTDSQGRFTVAGLKGASVLTPIRTGYKFDPDFMIVKSSQADLKIVGAIDSGSLGNKGLLTVTIDWDKVQPVTPRGSLPSEVNVVGARLVYPDDNAAFVQSTNMETATTDGVITLEVPPTEKAHLFVVAAAQKQESSNIYTGVAYRFGVVKDIKITKWTEQKVKVDDIEWTTPEWQIDDEQYWNEVKTHNTLTIRPDSISNGKAYIPMWITDPFSTKSSSYWTEVAIMPSGPWSPSEKIEDGRAYYKWDYSYHETIAQPIVKGSLFNLKCDPIVLPLGNARIIWP